MKKRILYLTTWDYANSATDGVCCKIDSEIKTFIDAGLHVDKIYLLNKDIHFLKDGLDRIIGHTGKYKKIVAYMNMYKCIKNAKYDWIYNRYGMFDPFYIRVLKRLNKNGARILIEVPTYPYKWERNKGLLNWILFFLDSICLGSASKYIDRVLTYSNDKTIWNVPTINIINGINVGLYRQKGMNKAHDKQINLVAIALMQPSHGYERIIKGISEYYKLSKGRYEVFLHLIGDGPELSFYKNIVIDNSLEKYVFFHGRMDQEQIADFIDGMDLGVCALAGYKKNVFLTSELKSREYIVRGIPFVYACDMDIEDKLDGDMAIKFENNDSVIDINRIVEFYEEIKDSYQRISNKMHALACDRLDMSHTMKPVIDYIEWK